MIEAANRAGADWSLVYGGRTAASMAFTCHLIAIGDRRVHLRPQDQCGLLDINGLPSEPDPDTLIYCCGPEPLLAAVQAASAHWPAGSLHVERFAARATVEEGGTDSTFEVELAQSGITVTVPPEVSIVDVAEAAGAPSSTRARREPVDRARSRCSAANPTTGTRSFPKPNASRARA